MGLTSVIPSIPLSSITSHDVTLAPSADAKVADASREALRKILNSLTRAGQMK